MGSFNGANVGFGYCGHFPSLADLTARLSPTAFAGRIATIEITAGRAQLFFCDGNSWLATVQDPSSVAITDGTIGGVAVSAIATAATNAVSAAAPRRLPHWFATSLSGKKVAFVGDSTSQQLFTNGAITTGDVASAAVPARYDSEAGGTTWYNFGRNGGTLADFNALPATTRGINEIIAAAPDLIVFSYGINDTRQGATSTAQLVTSIKLAINTLKVALPNCDFILRMPNSFTTNDVGSNGYVTANGLFAGMTVAQAAQAASTILKDAYRSLYGQWSNVALYDSQKNVFPETSVDSSATGLMADQIHPNVTGYRMVIDQLVQGYFGASAVEKMGNGSAIGDFNTMRAALAREFNLGTALNAVTAQGVRLAPTVYPQIVFNGDYDLVVAGYTTGAITAGQVSTQIGEFVASNLFTQPGTQGGGLQVDDVVVQVSSAGVFACLLLNVSGTKNTTALQITSGFSASSPNALVAQASGDPVLVFRHRYANSANAKAIAVQSQYKARAVYRVAASALGSVTLVATNQGPKDVQWTPRTGDVLSFSDIADITLTTAMTLTMNASGSQITINQTGTDFTTTGNLCQIAGTGSNRAETNLAIPLRLDIDGALSVTAYFRTMTRNGRYRNAATPRLDVAGTGATTINIRTNLNGTATALIATVTFASGATTGTIAYQFNNELPIAADVPIKFDVTAVGTSAAGLHLAWDQ